MELMTEVTDLTNSAGSQQTMIDQVEGSFGTLMTSITDLRDGNTANSVALAQQKAIDASQDKRLEQMVDDVTGLEHKVSALASKVNILRLTVDDLPDFASLQARIDAIVVENTRLEGEAATNKAELTDLTMRITTANEDLDIINGADPAGLVPTATTNLNEIQTRVTDTQTTIEDNLAKILDLEADVGNQMIMADYFYVNDAPIVVNTADFDDATFEFCLPAGETMEFHLSMTDQAGVELDAGTGDPTTTLNGNVVKAVVLRETVANVTVAESRQIDTDPRGHQHSIFYKVTNMSGDTQTYAIRLEADVSFAASAMDAEYAQVPVGNLQWSYRTYAAGYPLEAPAGVCI